MGIDYHVSNALDKVVTLKGIDENSLADGLETLYKSNYKPLLDDLRTMRSRISAMTGHCIWWSRRLPSSLGARMRAC